MSLRISEIGGDTIRNFVRFPNCFQGRNVLGPRFDLTARSDRYDESADNRFVIIDFQVSRTRFCVEIARGYYARGGRSTTTFLAGSIDLYALYNNLI